MKKKTDATDLGFVLRQALIDTEFLFASERKFTKLMDRGQEYSASETGNTQFLFSVTGPHLHPNLIL